MTCKWDYLNSVAIVMFDKILGAHVMFDKIPQWWESWKKSFFFFFKIITFCICYSFPSECEWNICQLWKLYRIMCLRTSSKLCFIFLVASIKVVHRTIEGTSAVFSHPWDNSWTFGNGIIDKEIFGCLLVLEEMNGAFVGVVTKESSNYWN